MTASGERKRPSARSQASLVELAEDWLMAKELASRSTSPNSTLARRRDLCRWGRAIRAGLGRPVDDTERLSIEGDLAGVRLSDLTADNCLQALAVLRGSGKASSTALALSTWRGFCHWLTRRGYLKVDPTDDDLLTAPAVVERLPRAFTADEIDDLRSAAADPPVSATGAWPTRDVMILELLAGSGCRVSELCALQIGDVDRRHEHRSCVCGTRRTARNATSLSRPGSLGSSTGISLNG